MDDPSLLRTTAESLIELDVAEDDDLFKADNVEANTSQNLINPKEKDQQSPLAKTSEKDISSSVENTPANSSADYTRSKRTKKASTKISTENYWDDKDIQHLRKPFQLGWKREVVYRNSKATSDKLLADVYYFSPTGKKLRSLIEIGAYLSKNDTTELNLTHFTFKKKTIFGPPAETERKASTRQEKTPVADQKQKVSNSSKTGTADRKTGVSNKKTSFADKKTDVSKSIKTSNADKATGLFNGRDISTPVTTSSRSRLNSEHIILNQNQTPKRNNVYSHNSKVDSLSHVESLTSPQTCVDDSTLVESSSDEENKSVPSNTKPPVPKSSSKQTAAMMKLKKANAKAFDDYQSIFGKPSNLIASIVSQANLKRKSEHDLETLDAPENKMKRTEPSDVAVPTVTMLQLQPNSASNILNTCGPWCLGTSAFQFCADCKNIHHSLCSKVLGSDKSGSICMKCSAKTKLKIVSKLTSQEKVIYLHTPATTVSSNSSQARLVSPAIHVGQASLTNYSIPRPPPLMRADQFKVSQPFIQSGQGLPPPPRLHPAGRVSESLAMPGLLWATPQAVNETSIVPGPLCTPALHPQLPLLIPTFLEMSTEPSLKQGQAEAAVVSNVQKNVGDLIKDTQSSAPPLAPACETTTTLHDKTTSIHVDDDIDKFLPVSFEKATVDSDGPPTPSCNTESSIGEVGPPATKGDASDTVSSTDHPPTPMVESQAMNTKKKFVQKWTYNSYIQSLMIHCFPFSVMMNIFRHLHIQDLLGLCLVCKKWKALALQPCLWHEVHLNNVYIKGWMQAARFFNKVEVKKLNMENMNSVENSWDSIVQAIPEIKTLVHLTFHKVPANVLDALTQMMPDLVNISTWAIIGDQEILPITKSLDHWAEAVKKVKSGQLTISCAATMYNISEHDLSQLNEPKSNQPLTVDDTNSLLITCMRLSKMGFRIQLSSVVLKSLELLFSKYNKAGLNTLLLQHCNNLFTRNLPLLQCDNVLSTDIKCRLEGHYSSLSRLQQTFHPKILSPSQILVFDMKCFKVSINGVIVNITGLSLMSACPDTDVYPILLISPSMIGLNHPYITMAQGKDGVPSSQLVTIYLSRMIKQEREKPKIIVCNSSPDLFSEKCISFCISSHVYLHCVEEDLAKYVFPGCLGGPLFRVKTYVDHMPSLSVEKFLEFIINHFQSKSQLVKDIKQAFTASGLFPLNSKAPYEYNSDLAGSIENTNLIKTKISQKLASNQKAEKAKIIQKLASNQKAEKEVLGKDHNSLYDIVLSADKSTNVSEGSSSELLETGEKKHLKGSPIKSDSKQFQSHNNTALKLTDKSGQSDKVGLLEMSQNPIPCNGSAARSAKKKSKDSPMVNSESLKHCIKATEKIKGDKMNCSGKAEVSSEISESQAGNKVGLLAISQNPILCSVGIENGSVARSTKGKSKKSPMVNSESLKHCVKASEKIKGDKMNCSGKAEDSSEISEVGNCFKFKGDSIGKCAINAYNGSNKLFIHKYLRNVNLKKRINKAKKLVKIACVKQRQKTLSTLTESVTNNISYVPFQREELLYGLKKMNTKSMSNQNMEKVINSAITESRAVDTGSRAVDQSVIPSGQVSQPTLQKHQSENVLNLSSRIVDKCFDKVLKTSDPVTLDDSCKDKAPREKCNSPTKGFRKYRSSEKKRPHRRKDPDNDTGSRAVDRSHILVISSGQVSQPTLQKHQSENFLNLSNRIVDKCFDKVLKTSDFVTLDDSCKDKAPREKCNSPTKGFRKGRSSEKKRLYSRKDSDTELPDKSFDILIKKHILNDGAKVVTEVIKNDFSELIASDFVQQVTLADHDYFRKSCDSDVISSPSKPITRTTTGKLSTTMKGKDVVGKESGASSSHSSSVSDNVSSDSSGTESGETSADSDWSQSKPEGPKRNKRRQKKKSKIGSSDSSSPSCAVSSSDEEVDEEEEEDGSEEDKDGSEQDEDGSEEDKEESKCQICLKSNPPNYKGEVIDWVDCDGNCNRWFHIVCINRSQCTADVEHYICTYCQQSS